MGWMEQHGPLPDEGTSLSLSALDIDLFIGILTVRCGDDGAVSIDGNPVDWLKTSAGGPLGKARCGRKGGVPESTTIRSKLGNMVHGQSEGQRRAGVP